MRVFWRIRNADGVRVCDRATLDDCRRLIETYAKPGTFPGWSNGPYKIFRVTAMPKEGTDRE